MSIFLKFIIYVYDIKQVLHATVTPLAPLVLALSLFRQTHVCTAVVFGHTKNQLALQRAVRVMFVTLRLFIKKR